ncbi:MAG: transglycosylase SLT domain-containing protein [Actinobacteria bacterium]|nr:transglycosylase SLT domain-containing protein [Tetrasphaera sp.]MCA0323014.1 transglycosylase SLT domain-containing protein [Actinomycetota bacterium]
MSSYRGRHAARHAAARPQRVSTVGAALRRPAVATSLALATVATGAAGVSAQERVAVESTAFSLSPAALTQVEDTAAPAADDQARLAADRSAANAQKSLVMAQAEEATRAAAAEAARVRAEEDARIAREAERQAIVDNARVNPQAAARALMGEFGFADSQWSCLNNLVIGESTWNYKAKNPSSGAYGLFQSLPASKMSTVADDWADNPVTQIRWGLQYIKSSYGTPCGAWSAWNSRYPHWY